MIAPIVFFVACVALAIAWGRMGLRGKAVMQTWAGLGIAVLCGLRLAGFDDGRRTLFDSARLETLWLIFILTLGLVAASVGGAAAQEAARQTTAEELWMTRWVRLAWSGAVAALALTLTPVLATAQSESRTPRTEWGAPDLGGIWDFRTMTPLERPRDLVGKDAWSVEEAAAYERQVLERRERRALNPGSVHAAWWLDNGTELTDDRRTSLIVDPPDGRIPAITPQATEIQEAQAALERPVRLRQSRNSPAYGPEDLGIGERCLLGFSSGPPITPSAYNNNLMVFQTPEHVVLVTEMVHEARVVPLDGRPHISTRIPQWLGDSRGRWDGDTLVVESRNFTDKIGSFSTLGVAIGAGDTLHLVERFTRVDAHTLLYEFRIDDPDTFTRPFTAAIPMKSTEAPLYEFACHEGNRGLVGMLRGARAVERAEPPTDQSK